MKTDRPIATISAVTDNSISIETGGVFILVTDQGDDGVHLQVQSNGQRVTVQP